MSSRGVFGDTQIVDSFEFLKKINTKVSVLVIPNLICLVNCHVLFRFNTRKR